MKKIEPKKILKALAWTIWVLFIIFIPQFIVTYPIYWIIGSRITEPLWNAIVNILDYVLMITLAVFVTPIIFKKKKTTRDEMGLTGLPTWTDIGLAPIGFVTSLLVAQIFTAIFSFFPWFDAVETQKIGYSTLVVGMDRVITFVILVIVAPIAEEIFFRGWLYGKLRKKTNMIVAIILASLTFAIAHLQWNVGVTVFAMSIILCLLREFTGTIYSGIILHMIKNGVAFYLLYILGVS